jgi:hypothetical protein
MAVNLCSKVWRDIISLLKIGRKEKLMEPVTSGNTKASEGAQLSLRGLTYGTFLKPFSLVPPEGLPC